MKRLFNGFWDGFVLDEHKGSFMDSDWYHVGFFIGVIPYFKLSGFIFFVVSAYKMLFL